MSDILPFLHRAANKVFIDRIRRSDKSIFTIRLDEWQKIMGIAVDAEYYFGEENLSRETGEMSFTSFRIKCSKDEKMLDRHIWENLKRMASSIEKKVPAAMNMAEGVKYLNAALAKEECIIYIDRATFTSDPNLQEQITRLSSTVIIAMPTSSVPHECKDEYRGQVEPYSIMCSELDWDDIVSRMSSPETLAFIAGHTGCEFKTEAIIQIHRHKFQAAPDAIARILGDLKTPVPETAAESVSA